MADFFDALDELAVQEPEMEQAVDNIRNDLRSDRHPYGISQELQASLDRSTEDGTDILKVVDSHRSIEKPELHVEAEIPSDQIKRVMSLHSFCRYHLANSDFESNGTFNALLEDVVNLYFSALRAGHANSTEKTIDSEEFAGITGRPQTPTWWTWLEENDSPPGNGKIYMLELALSEKEHRFAQTSGIVVEITLEKQDLGNALKTKGTEGIPFFRSTGLDSFSEDTPFRPNLKPEPFGRTCPTPPATKERPEAVSESISYEELEENVRIVLTGFRC